MKSIKNIRALLTASLTAALYISLSPSSVAAQSNDRPSGVVDDWTFHRLVFSGPGTMSDAEHSGTVEKRQAMTNDPRYKMELRRRSLSQLLRTQKIQQAEPLLQALSQRKNTVKDPIEKDWSQTLTSGGVAATLTGVIGTLNSSSISGSSSLTVDGVKFTASAPVSATATGTFSTEPSSGSTLTISGLGSKLILTAGSSTSTSCVFSGGSSTVTFARSGTTNSNAISLAALINVNGCGSVVGVSATAPGSSAIKISAVTPGTGGNSITLLATSSPNFRISGWTSSTPLASGTNGTTSGTTFAYWSSNTYASSSTVASNIATAITDNATVSAVLTASPNTPASGDVTFTAKAAGVSANAYQVTESGFSAFSPSSATLSGGTAGVQPNMYPAKFSFSATGASCTDFVVYPTGATGAAGAANVIAYDKLYSGATGTGGCGTTGVPAVYWAYNTGGTVTTSPVLSPDGSQVAFMQVSGTTASLVMLKWAAAGGSITSPTSLTAQASASAYRNCTAPCYYALSLGANDTLSAPFYDYLRDALYVGDDIGNLHQFFGIFNGNPSENTTSPWPVHLGANKVSSPVYDSETGFQAGYIFVGDMGGVFYSVGSGYGGTTSGTIYGNTGSLGDAIADAPLVDCPQGVEYVFVTTNGSYSETGDNAVWEFVSIFTNLVPAGQAGSPGVVPVGVGGTGYYLYSGTFDNLYFQSSPPSYAATGNIYVVGNTGTPGGATLYQVPISLSSLTGAVNVVATGLNSSEHAFPSPVTEFCNGTCASNGTETTSGTDYVFFSVNRGAKTGCTNAAGNGCILSYNVSNPNSVTEAGSGLNVVTPGTNGCWATSGIIIDNSSTTSGASQIYFENLNGNTAGGPTGATSSNCTVGTAANMDAVQAAQSNP